MPGVQSELIALAKGELARIGGDQAVVLTTKKGGFGG
jgi:hypothetical protein